MANTKSQKNGFVNDLKFYFLLSRKASQVEYWVVTFFFVFIASSISLIVEQFTEMGFWNSVRTQSPEPFLFSIIYSSFTAPLVVGLAFVCWLTAVWRRVLTLGWKISTLVWLIVPVFNLAFVVIIGIMPDRK